MRSCPEIRFIRDDSAQRGEEARPGRLWLWRRSMLMQSCLMDASARCVRQPAYVHRSAPAAVPDPPEVALASDCNYPMCRVCPV